MLTSQFMRLTGGHLHRLTHLHRIYLTRQLSAKFPITPTDFDKFRLDASTHKRVNFRQFEKIVQDETISPQDANLLVAALAYLPDQNSETRQKLFYDLFNRFVRDQVLNSTLYCGLVHIIAEQKIQVNVESLLTQANLPETGELLGAQLKYHCALGNHEGIDRILGKIKSQNVKMTEQMYSYLILGCSRQQDMNGVRDTLDIMAAANIDLGSDSYTELVKAYLENGQHVKAYDLLQRIEGLPDSSVVNIIRSIVQNATSFSSTVELKNALSLVMRHLSEASVKDPEITPAIRNICTELAMAKQYDTVVALIECLPVPQYLPFTSNADQYMARLIREFVKAETSTSADVLRFCKFLLDSKRNERAIHVAIEAALKYGRDKMAVELLKHLSSRESLRPHYFWPLFLSAQRKNREAGILQVLKLMRSLNVDVDDETVNNYLLPKLSITLKDTKCAIKVLEDHGLTLASFITALASSLLYQRRVSDVLDILKSYPTRVTGESLVRPLVMLGTLKAVTPLEMAKLVRLVNERNLVGSFDVGGNVLIELVSSPKMNKQLERAVEEMLGEFHLIGVQISPIAADILRQHFLKTAESNGQLTSEKELLLKKIINKDLNIPAVESYTAKNLVHPRDMNLEQLECHLLELQAKEMNTRGVLRRLLTLNCREGKLQRAKEVKAMCDKLNVDLSPGMMANIFDLYVRTNDSAMASKTLEEMRTKFPGFLLDEHKVVDYAALLVGEQQFDRAKAVLKKHASQRAVKGGEKILKNLWKLLKNVSVASVALQSPENLTNSFFKLLVQLGYCDARNNTLLGPIIREHLMKGELRLAVEQFKEFCTKYRKTPLQMELYTILIGVSNNSYAGQTDLTAEEAKTHLNECVAHASAIHGAENTHIHLVIALAEAGTANQLRKLLIDPAVRITFDTLRKQCEHLSELGKIEPVLRLAKSSRGLGNINEQELYNTILKHFVRVNDCEAAIGLYERIMDDDDFKLSGAFMGNLVDLLEKNNLDVPTSVAIYAKRENL